ncbi:ADP-ribosylation factor-like protein 4C [Homarus americanus]|uniref:ADP-ribosylation factor-like protein 4C-like 3 n=1 Tax=Homarus americanus TaxID=6706 RepID=A0A8J5JN73_HOMAM|nr:ADP-ribosylation factor-like protein 4C [Homarus americanus]KAG7156159.1 ADP-ribosylation factor-like protein 4C-like 3 [Homarus americanus]
MCSCLWVGMAEAAQYLMWEAATLVRPPTHVVLVGLDSSGKTTVLFRLRYGQYVNAVPTVGFNTEKVRAGGGHWLVWDVGGAERVRPLWRSYTRATDALIFVVDSSSCEERLEENRVELQRLTKQQTAQCVALNRARPPLLVLANKQDLPGAREPQHLAKAMGLPELPDTQPWAVAPACAVTGEGLDEAMALLYQLVTKTRQASKR